MKFNITKEWVARRLEEFQDTCAGIPPWANLIHGWRFEIFRKTQGRCFYCAEPLGRDWTIDHVQPLSKGGSDIPENMVPCCPKCNSEKGDKVS